MGMNAEASAHILITSAASQALRNVTHSMFLNTLQNNSPKHHKHHTQTAYHTQHTYATSHIGEAVSFTALSAGPAETAGTLWDSM